MNKEYLPLGAFAVAILLGMTAMWGKPDNSMDEHKQKLLKEQALRDEFLAPCVTSLNNPSLQTVLAMRGEYGKILREKGSTYADKWAQDIGANQLHVSVLPKRRVCVNNHKTVV